jgi:glycerol uptake facilitator-like aquaporin
MGDRLCAGNTAVALLANSLATGTALVALILCLAPAHFNPVVTLVAAAGRDVSWRRVPAMILSQVAGAFAGVLLAHAMFGERLLMVSRRSRAEAGMLLGEGIATFGLLAVVLGCAKRRPDSTAVAVGAYIAGAYWFTSSTSFANPAVTLARCVTDTFAGIRPADAPGFILAQAAGAALAGIVFTWLHRREGS